MVRLNENAFLGELARLFKRAAHRKGLNTISMTISRHTPELHRRADKLKENSRKKGTLDHCCLVRARVGKSRISCEIHEDRRVEFQRQFADLFLVYTNDLKATDVDLVKDSLALKSSSRAKKNSGGGGGAKKSSQSGKSSSS